MPQHPGHIERAFIGKVPGPQARGAARDATITRGATTRRDLFPRGRSVGPGPRVRRRREGPNLLDVFGAVFQGLIDLNDPLSLVDAPAARGAAAFNLITSRPARNTGARLLDALRDIKREAQVLPSRVDELEETRRAALGQVSDILGRENIFVPGVGR